MEYEHSHPHFLSTKYFSQSRNGTVIELLNKTPISIRHASKRVYFAIIISKSCTSLTCALAQFSVVKFMILQLLKYKKVWNSFFCTFFKEFSLPPLLSPLEKSDSFSFSLHNTNWTDFLYVSNVSLFSAFNQVGVFFLVVACSLCVVLFHRFWSQKGLQRFCCAYSIKHTKSKRWNMKNKIKMFQEEKKLYSTRLEFSLRFFCMIATFSTVELKWQLQLRIKYKLHSTSTRQPAQNLNSPQ